MVWLCDLVCDMACPSSVFFDSHSLLLLLLRLFPLHSLSFPIMLRVQHHQDGRRYGGIWERSWLRPYSPYRGMFLWLDVFVHSHTDIHKTYYSRLRVGACVISLCFYGNSDAPCKTTGGGGGWWGGWQVASDAKGANASPPPPPAAMQINAGQMFLLM